MARSSSLRSVAERTLLAAVDDVWRFVAEPYHLSDWWPGITGVEPDRRGMAAGARWKVVGPSYLRRPETARVLLVHAVAPRERLAFELPSERIQVDVRLHAAAAGRTAVAVAVEGPLVLGPRRRLATLALNRLYDLVQTGADT